MHHTHQSHISFHRTLNQQGCLALVAHTPEATGFILPPEVGDIADHTPERQLSIIGDTVCRAAFVMAVQRIPYYDAIASAAYETREGASLARLDQIHSAAVNLAEVPEITAIEQRQRLHELYAIGLNSRILGGTLALLANKYRPNQQEPRLLEIKTRFNPPVSAPANAHGHLTHASLSLPKNGRGILVALKATHEFKGSIRPISGVFRLQTTRAAERSEYSISAQYDQRSGDDITAIAKALRYMTTVARSMAQESNETKIVSY